METDNKREERIHGYLHNLMPNAEKSAFQNEMETDKELKEDVLISQRLKWLLTEKEELKERVRKLVKSAKASFPIIEESVFRELIRDIVYDVLPDESIAFELAGADLIHELFEGKSLQENNPIGELNFSEQPESIIQFIHIITGTYELINKYKNQIKVEISQVYDYWAEMMMKNGLDKEVAYEISKKYAFRVI